MHKKLTSELISLANSILTMSKDTDIVLLHKKSRKLYEKLSVLKFVEKNMGIATVHADKLTKEVNQNSVAAKITVPKPVIAVEKKAEKELPEVVNTVIQVPETQKPVAQPSTPVSESIEKEPTPSPDTSNSIEEAIKAAKDIKRATELKYSLENEFKDAVSADMAQQIFERADTRVIESELSAPKTAPIEKTLNNSSVHNGLQIGLNDRIAFVKYLFNGNLTDFNRVLSQLNTFTNEKEATNFISKMVKPDYNWNDHEDIENRLLYIIERKFS
ncbi:MAG: hypothetical protein JKY08_07920 [Flavobacteriaceae bacterium]|nr:hypothetical protein [Flavobacteriaceae bacterium]